MIFPGTEQRFARRTVLISVGCDSKYRYFVKGVLIDEIQETRGY